VIDVLVFLVLSEHRRVVISIPTLYLGGPDSEFQPGYPDFSPLRQFIIHSISTTGRYIISAVEEAS